MDASNRKDVRRLEKEGKLRQQQAQEITRDIMATQPGRQWMHDMLIRCHIFSVSMNADPFRMAFAEGERNIGLQLLNDIMATSAEEYITMMNEANERNEVDAARSGRNGDNGSAGDGDSGPDEDDSSDNGAASVGPDGFVRYES